MNYLVTGSSSGIGRTVAERLVGTGHNVVLMARREELLKEISDDLNQGAELHAAYSPGDVGNVEDCEAAVRHGVEAFGRLDGLVNSAGDWVDKPLVEAEYEEIRRFVDTDVTGALQITRAILPPLVDQGFGRILHINGLQGFIRQRSPVLYAAVESAVRGLCESLRWEVRSDGVHVSLITLGAVAASKDQPLATGGDRTDLTMGEVADVILFMLNQPDGVNVDEVVLTPLGNKW